MSDVPGGLVGGGDLTRSDWKRVPVYSYKAEVRRIIDGDTLELIIDLGFTVQMKTVVRLFGINTPETHGAKAKTEKAAGDAAVEFVQTWCRNAGFQVVVDTRDGKPLKQEKYGRWLATVWSGDSCLNEELVKAGHAVEVRY